MPDETIVQDPHTRPGATCLTLGEPASVGTPEQTAAHEATKTDEAPNDFLQRLMAAANAELMNPARHEAAEIWDALLWSPAARDRSGNPTCDFPHVLRDKLAHPRRPGAGSRLGKLLGRNKGF